MTKLRMGINNKITKERYASVRAALAEGMGKHAIMSRYHIGETTLRRIRRAETYYAYQIMNEKSPRVGKMPTVVCAVAGVPYEDVGLEKRPAKKQDIQPAQTALGYETTAKMIKVVTLGWVAVIFFILATLVVCQFIK